MFPFAIRLIRGAVVLLVLLVLASAALPLRPGPESTPLRVQFTADPMIGYAPLDVVLDATDDIPAEFYGWEIDWDGDGIIDDEGNDEPAPAASDEEKKPA